jgi:hypothetical protein
LKGLMQVLVSYYPPFKKPVFITYAEYAARRFNYGYFFSVDVIKILFVLIGRRSGMVALN